MSVVLRELSAWSLVGLSLVPSAHYAGVRIVTTPSVPMGLYATRALGEDEVPGVGAYVCLPPLSSEGPRALRQAFADGLLPSAWRTRPLLKRVSATAGDVVTYSEAGVLVNGRALPSSVALRVDRQGNALPAPLYPQQLGPSEVWLASEHPRGFDSRYFGPVRVEALTCVGEPLWTI